MSTKLGLVYDEAMLAHKSETPHPEQPARISSIYAALQEAGVVERCGKTMRFVCCCSSCYFLNFKLPARILCACSRCVRIPARKAREEELEGVHTSAYVSLITESLPTFSARELRLRGNAWNSIYLCDATTNSALYAAGSTVAITEEVCTLRCCVQSDDLSSMLCHLCDVL